jgi:hypothetical protein
MNPFWEWWNSSPSIIGWIVIWVVAAVFFYLCVSVVVGG